MHEGKIDLTPSNLNLEKNIIGDYELFELLGKGTFASVWEGRHRPTGCPVAIKQFIQDKFSAPDVIATMEREIMIMKMLDYPFVIDLYEVIKIENSIFIAMEYVEEGTLLEHVNKYGPLNEDTIREIFAQIFAVLQYLQKEKRIVHRDLKAENILLDQNHNIRVIDFGLSNILNQNTSVLNTACGSPAYVSPEMLLEKPYTQAADIWSAGILLYAISASCLPFEDPNISKLIQMILRDEPSYPPTFSASLTDLIKRMLTKDPNQRITLDGIRQHPWFTQDSRGSTLTYNFQTLDRFRVCLDPLNFVANDEIIDQMEQCGIDTSNLTEYITSGAVNSTTAAYRMLLRSKNTEEMDEIMADVILKLSDRLWSLSSVSINGKRGIPLDDIAKPNSSSTTETHLSKITPEQRYSSMPTINKIPSRGPNRMQLINLIQPNIQSSSKEKVKMRTSLGQPHVFVFKNPIAPKK